MWAPLSEADITQVLKTASPKSAPGPSGVGYTILKWAHATCPAALTKIYNLCLDLGVHPWNDATIVVINKPQKPDYSLPKAYRPISLLECTGKLLEKIVTNKVNSDIQTYDLLPMGQFGSRPHHNAIDAVATLVHRVQHTSAIGNVGALLLFDISGFFDNLNPDRTANIFRDKGFPSGVVKWVKNFMANRRATLKIGDFSTQPFGITHGTPQGSPLSPILSALYTANLIESATTWEHSDLTMYVDDGAIFATASTTITATNKARDSFTHILDWLHRNGLEVDPAKTEIMVFTPPRPNPNLTGGSIIGMKYTDPIYGECPITTTTSLRYLGVFLDHRLKWTNHVTIMANRARSTIRGINLLGNSVRGLDFMNWRKVYNALVIPVLTYGAQVWYTGHKQKGLIKILQTAQNDGIRKITGVFKTTPTEPLHNLSPALSNDSVG